ncbi:hypothetical protein cyc_03617 [Cyclospora cayetanensis]|uniref:Uncharacterized protein n=1 Tax=Cyclospora cayetanensis TaxID=88456 RepID=A0A1D3D9Q1_9EIME|nr:hypothetical protein cyc_03617 [Cyclospora cayetanensis]
MELAHPYLITLWCSIELGYSMETLPLRWLQEHRQPQRPKRSAVPPSLKTYGVVILGEFMVAGIWAPVKA